MMLRQHLHVCRSFIGGGTPVPPPAPPTPPAPPAPPADPNGGEQ